MSECKFLKKGEKMTIMVCGDRLKRLLLISYLGIISDSAITRAGIIKDGNKTLVGVRIIWADKMEASKVRWVLCLLMRAYGEII